jgi:hypothetical protein
MNKHILSLILLLALTPTLVLAQTEPRLPKGIRGLEDAQANPPSANWLLDARDDTERFRRIQIYAGGTYEQMWQIGYRFEQAWHAINDENWQLGLHHWTKLRDVFNVALMKRPNRTPNAETMFLDNNWALLEQALRNEDAAAARSAFLAERGACMACHVAENMAFLNDSPVFRNTAVFP